MKLEGIIFNNEYYPSKGLYKGIPYSVTEENDNFVLNKVSLGVGVGILRTPVCLFPKNKVEPFYSIKGK